MNSKTQICLIALVYLVIICIGSSLKPRLEQYAPQILASHLEAAINKLFITKYGCLTFSIIFFINGPSILGILIFCINTLAAIILNVWFFGDSIFKRWDIRAGGHCALFNSEGICSYWLSSFDPSGHIYASVSMSLMLLVVISTRSSSSSSSSALQNSKYFVFTEICNAILLCGWLSMMVVTSLFFHTFTEKILGFILGALIPLTWNYSPHKFSPSIRT